MRVLIFGDSIAQGFYDSEGGWVERLRRGYDRALIQNHDRSQPTVFNLGISGDTTAALLARLEHEIIARKWPDEAFVIIIAIGANDTIYRGDDHDSEPDIFQKQLADILAITKKYTNKTIFVGLFPVADALLQPMPWSSTGKCYSTKRMELFDTALREFCGNVKAPYIDVWSHFEQVQDLNELLYDGIHPSDKGHELIAKIVRSELSKLINS